MQRNTYFHNFYTQTHAQCHTRPTSSYINSGGFRGRQGRLRPLGDGPTPSR